MASSICPSASAIRIALEETGRSAISTCGCTSTSMPSRRRLADQKARRADPALAEMKVVADRDAADSEPLDQIMVNEILRRGSGAGLVEGHHHGAREPGSGQQPQLSGLVGEPELRGVRAEETARMRLERHRQRGLAMGAAHSQRGLDHGAVAEMDAVEIAHRDHDSLGDRGRGRGIADNDKVWTSFRSLGVFNSGRLRGRTVTWPARRSQARASSCGRPGCQVYFLPAAG